jgi:cbb3-type cytochrome oxidase subunit 3
MSELNEATTKKSNGVFIGIILLLLVGIGVMAVMYSKKNSELNDCMNDNLELKQQMDDMNKMMAPYIGEDATDNLLKDFKNMVDDYDKIIKEGREEDQEAMKEQQAKIQGLIGELETAKRSGNVKASLIAKLNRENETLRTIMKGYVKQIDELNTKNLQLTSDLDQTTTQLNSTTVERDTYKQDAEAKGEQVKKGSRLQAYGFSSVGLRMKLNNMTEESNKAKSVVQIKSSFTISENPITTAGKKTVYMQVVNPDGKTLQSRSSNTVQTEAGNIAFSDKKDIDYNNERIDLSIYYDLKGEEAIKGNYKVKIYCDGNLIGTDSFTLK